MDKKWKGETVLIPVPFTIPAGGLAAASVITLKEALPPGFLVTDIYADRRSAVTADTTGSLEVGDGQDQDGYFTDLVGAADSFVDADGALSRFKSAANNDNGNLDVVLTAVTDVVTAGEGVIYFEGVQG